MTLDLENFEEVRIKGEELYRSFDEVLCPYFKSKVSFNAVVFASFAKQSRM